MSAQNVWVIGSNGKLVGGNGPPGLAFNYSDMTAITGAQIITLSQGDLPKGPDEIALDEGTADKAGYDIGDEVTLVPPTGALTLKVQTTRRTARVQLTFRPVEGAPQKRQLTIRQKSKRWGRGAK